MVAALKHSGSSRDLRQMGGMVGLGGVSRRRRSGCSDKPLTGPTKLMMMMWPLLLLTDDDGGCR
ncbi:hypothetical protein Hanom_Chr07g00610701 [Helianthus anomalus]